ncbi:hypothetical protein KR009_009681 [Drosophila setifemur]|nr:hypothetical protein KR009_009681 [Drosophila setifemur]
MSQQIRVLQCFECKMYQVDLVKKSNKWECKICRQKQDLLKEFFRGSGPECRAKVQQLNLERGQREEQNLILKAQQQLEQENSSPEKQENLPLHQKPNKWASYVDESVEAKPPSSADPRKAADEELDLTEGVSTNNKRSRKQANKTVKRAAESEPLVAKKSSKWNEFV